VTPFTKDEAATIDTRKLGALVDRLMVADLHAIAPLGSTGELAYLDETEFDTVVDAAMAAVAVRVPVVVGVSDRTTAKTIRRTQYAQQAGADVVMVLPVSDWKLSEREIFKHFLSIGDAIGISDHGVQQPGTSAVHMAGVTDSHVRKHRQRLYGQRVHRRPFPHAAHQPAPRRPTAVLPRQ
jgi:4-hydroxy-tetrahydrodipicolinate synthase